MFDMEKWREYLQQYLLNAEKAGATIAERQLLLHLEEGKLIMQNRALEVLNGTGSDTAT